MNVDMVTATRTELKEQLRIVETNIRKLTGALVTMRRLNQGLTQDELAAKLGISRPTLSKIETPEGSCVKASTLEKVFNYLKINAEEIQKIEAAAPHINPDDLAPLFPGNTTLQDIFVGAITATAGQSKSIDPNFFSRAAMVTAILQDYPLAKRQP